MAGGVLMHIYVIPDYHLHSKQLNSLLQMVFYGKTFSKEISPTGNRTPVSRVTGGDTYHYTIEDDWMLHKLRFI